ncbi:Slc24a1 [Symbiodinium sp. CCMP2456]|nr:Slc24a1 [Symbiodinium sp. CCMP2456]
MVCCPSGSEPYLAAEFQTRGQEGDAQGVGYYVVGEGSRTAILFLPDIWGWNGGRTRALADTLAADLQTSVWIPKILEPYQGGTDGDGLPPAFDMVSRRAEIAPDRFKGPWHPSKTLPKVLKVVDAMRQSGVKRFGVLGVCYGAWVGFHLAKAVPSWELICGASPHPSLHMEGVVGGDPAALASEIRCPWAFFPCGEVGKDGADPPIYDAEGDVFRALEARFPGKNVTKRYRTVRHGFFARGAIKDGQFKAGDGDQVKRAVAECVSDVSSFFRKRGLFRADARSYLRMICWCCC